MPKYARRYKRITKRKRGGRKTVRVARRGVASGRRRLGAGYDTRFPLPNTMFSGKPVFGDRVGTTQAPTSAPKRGRVPGGDVVRLGENTSMSASYLGKRQRGMRSMLSATGTGGVKKLYGNTVGMFDSQTGTQSTLTVGSLSRTDLNAIKTSLDADLPVEMKTGTNDMKVYFGDAVSRLHMKNQTNHVACVVLYDVIPLRSSDTSSLDTPSECWTQGVTQQGLASYATYPGNSPYESKEFTKRFKVVKSTRLYLEPGEQHEHVFVRRINKVFSSTWWDSTVSTAGETVGFLTGYTMAVIYGSIGHADTDAPASVSYMPVRVDWIHHVTVQYQYVGVQTKKTAFGANNITTLAPSAWNHLIASDDIQGGLATA